MKKEDFTEVYWNELWAWYDDGGLEDVAAYLANLDLSNFNPKSPPKKTPAFWAIVDAIVLPRTPSWRTPWTICTTRTPPPSTTS